MSDLAITAANVIPSANAQIQKFTAGATITQGEVVYQDADMTMKLAAANGASPICKVKGLAACGASPGQPVLVITQDRALAIGGTVPAGAVLIASAAPGAIAAAADAAPGWFVTVLGVGIGSNKINFSPVAAGVAS